MPTKSHKHITRQVTQKLIINLGGSISKRFNSLINISYVDNTNIQNIHIEYNSKKVHSGDNKTGRKKTIRVDFKVSP